MTGKHEARHAAPRRRTTGPLYHAREALADLASECALAFTESYLATRNRIETRAGIRR